ncbi:MAG: hypothetical protein AMJ45_01935 [Syntrophobacter sp. DG_60]|nr:MAG: hypothetical protein AMJ45_01935 [Syntrophobacter sp. DG_60]
MPWDWEEYARRKGKVNVPFQIDQLREKWSRFQKFAGPPIVVVILILIWMLSGIYIVSPDEMGVVKRFGKMARLTTPGPHYHLPYPIETAIKPKVTKVRRLEIGFRTISPGPPAEYRSLPEESLMLTGDENIVSVEFITQYKIKDPVDYLFNVEDIPKTVKDAAEAAMRETVGKTTIDEVLTVGKFRVQQETKQLLQSILDRYRAGVMVVAVQLQEVHPPKAVIHAFKDVASAKEDKVKFVNEAEAYRNDLLPKAKGKAAQVINEAMAYKETKIKTAKGDTDRFLNMLKEYKKAPLITKKRLYLETIENILSKTRNIVVPAGAEKIVLPLGERTLPELKK